MADQKLTDKSQQGTLATDSLIYAVNDPGGTPLDSKETVADLRDAIQSVTASSTITDNAIVRGDGGSRGVQESGVTIDDSDNVSGVNTLDAGSVDVDSVVIDGSTSGSHTLDAQATASGVSTFPNNTGTVLHDNSTATITNKTIDGDDNTLQDIATASLKNRTGVDLEVVTGTKGTAGDLATWDANGDLIDGPTPPSGAIVGTTDSQALTNKSVNGVTLTNAGATTSFLNEAGNYTVPAGGGDVTGPPSSVDDRIATFDGTTGKIIQDSGSLLSDFLQNVVEDTTPQLGGDLDVNGNDIVSASNADIPIIPDGTGEVVLGNYRFNSNQSVGPTEDNYVLTYDDGTGKIGLEASASGGDVSGPGSSVDDNLATFDGTTGKLIQDSGVAVSSLVTASSTTTFTNKTLDANGTGNAISNINVAEIETGSSLLDGKLGITIDGGGSAITTGIKGYLEIPYDCTIERATLLADQTGSVVVDVWKDTYANYPPTDADSITASAPPTITSDTDSQDSTLTGWTTSCTEGEILGFNVDSASTITRVTLSLAVTKD